MELLIFKSNPYLREKTADEIMALEVATLNGVSDAVKFFDRVTGVKTHQLYYVDIGKGKQPAVSITYKDIFDNNKRVAIQKTFVWYGLHQSDTISKVKICEKTEFTNYELDVKRRVNIQNEIVVQALTSSYPFFKPLLDEIFDLTSKELEIWRRTGNAQAFHKAINSASDDENEEIKNLFANTPFYAVNSLYKVLNLLPANDELILNENGEMKPDVKLIDNLKFFIK